MSGFEKKCQKKKRYGIKSEEIWNPKLQVRSSKHGFLKQTSKN
jgi:hypothetical protein